MFPQMTLLPDVKQAFQPGPWRPQFVDYLFLAFNTEHRVLPDRYSRPDPLGEGPDDDPVDDFAGRPGAPGGAGGKHFVSRGRL